MIRNILFFLFFLGITMLANSPAHSAIIPASNTSSIIPPGVYSKIATMKIKDIQKLVGRKLTLKEKLGIMVLKYKLKHPAKAEARKGKTALVFGILGLALFAISFFIGYVIIAALVASIVAIVSGTVASKADPSDKQAQAGKLLGWITLGCILVLTVLAVIAVASIF